MGGMEEAIVTGIVQWKYHTMSGYPNGMLDRAPPR
jgi:hypothetical protein